MREKVDDEKWNHRMETYSKNQCVCVCEREREREGERERERERERDMVCELKEKHIRQRSDERGTRLGESMCGWDIKSQY